MTTDKVTTPILKEMAMGETRVFRLPPPDPSRPEAPLAPAQIEANRAKALAYVKQRLWGCKFEARTDFVNLTLTVTKKPLPEETAGEGGEV